MIKNKSGFVLPYVLFLVMIIIEAVFLIIMLNVNVSKYYEDRDTYYRIFIYEERAKRHIIKRFENNPPQNAERETIYFENDYLHLFYDRDLINKRWVIEYRICINNIAEVGVFYYSLDTKKIATEVT